LKYKFEHLLKKIAEKMKEAMEFKRPKIERGYKNATYFPKRE